VLRGPTGDWGKWPPHAPVQAPAPNSAPAHVRAACQYGDREHDRRFAHLRVGPDVDDDVGVQRCQAGAGGCSSTKHNSASALSAAARQVRRAASLSLTASTTTVRPKCAGHAGSSTTRTGTSAAPQGSAGVLLRSSENWSRWQMEAISARSASSPACWAPTGVAGSSRNRPRKRSLEQAHSCQTGRVRLTSIERMVPSP
jgi:hypothetical protein